MELPDQLRPHLDRVNRLALTQTTLPNKLEALAEVLKRTVPGCDAVSIALVVEEATVTGAVSSQLAVEVDLVQYAHDEGPCLTSMAERSPVRIDVLRQDERFEHFAPGAVELGVESVLSVPLVWTGDVVGSINLYSTEPNAFTDATLTKVAPIASYAAEVIGGSPLYAASLDLVEVDHDVALTESYDGIDGRHQQRARGGVELARYGHHGDGAVEANHRLELASFAAGPFVIDLGSRIVARCLSTSGGPLSPNVHDDHLIQGVKSLAGA